MSRVNEAFKIEIKKQSSKYKMPQTAPINDKLQKLEVASKYWSNWLNFFEKLYFNICH